MATFQTIEPLLTGKLQRSISTLPPILGNEAVNWVKDNFRRQGYPDKSFTAWKPRAANAKRNAGRGILINTGRLSRSPRIMSTGVNRVDIGVDVPYAKAHNDGYTGVVTVKSHSRAKIGNIKMSSGKTGEFRTKRGITGSTQVKSHQRKMNLPRRRFIGASPILASILRRKAIVHIGRELKK